LFDELFNRCHAEFTRATVNQREAGSIALVGSGIGINNWQPLRGQPKKTAQNFENM